MATDAIRGLHQVLSAFHRSIRRRCHRLGDGLYRPGGSREEHHECEACEAQARATLGAPVDEHGLTASGPAVAVSIRVSGSVENRALPTRSSRLAEEVAGIALLGAVRAGLNVVERLAKSTIQVIGCDA